MSVIINDFEIVAEPPGENQRTGEASEPEADTRPAAPRLGPREVRAIVCHQQRRAGRVWAHCEAVTRTST